MSPLSFKFKNSKINKSINNTKNSYQNDGADGVGGKDVVLQGAAVALRLDVGGTLVMELEGF